MAITKTAYLGGGEKDTFVIYEQIVNPTYHVYLTDDVEHGSHLYSDLIHFFNSASSDTEIHIHLSNTGGSCQSGVKLAHAIKNSSAMTIIHVEAPCYSMGAILALTGKVLDMLPGTFLMFHNYSGGFGGKGGEITTQLQNYNKHSEHMTRYFCAPFLTEAEMKDIAADKDVYIHAEAADMKRRVTRHFNPRPKKNKLPKGAPAILLGNQDDSSI